jgi:NAD(P)-dependent dehydrogenase (short-subunit alcohol dehydrogenase family)
LKGRVGIVVGGNTGLGRFITVRLASEGAKLTVLDIKKPATSTDKSIVEELPKDASPATLVEGDLHAWAFVDKAYGDVIKAHGRIDFVVNCVPAGELEGQQTTPFAATTEDAWDAAMGVSAKAVFLSCKRAVQQLVTQDNAAVRGRIVNISSVYGGMVARKGAFTFGVAKSVVVQLTRQIAAEYASQGVVCNAVAPGHIDDSTDPRDCVPPSASNRVPAEEAGKALDVANAVLFLVSDETRYVHGTNLVVDGGFMAT